MEKLLKALELYIFPKHCLVCGVNENYICNKCELEIPLMLSYFCLLCGRTCPNGFIHRKCGNKYTPDRFLAAFEYSGVIKKALIKAKDKIFDVYTLLVDLAFEHFEGTGLVIGEDAIIVPLPLKRSEYREKTFDPALLISRLFAKKYGVEVRQIFIRNGKDRESFKINPVLIGSLKGKDLVLVDDIVDSGETMLSACRELRSLGRKGPRYIYCMSLAYSRPGKYKRYT